MFKRRVISNNVFTMVDGVLTQLPIGHVIETDNENYLGNKAETIEREELKLEVATPPKPTAAKRSSRK